MIIAKKIAISLFVTILFCGLFYFFALSGLFDYVEASLFHPRVQQRYQGLVEDATQRLEQFYTSNRSRFMAISSAPAVRSLFSFELSQETIETVEALFGQLRSQLPALAFTRIFDVSAQRLWFSTYATDIVRDNSVSRQYVSISALESEYYAPNILARGTEERDLLFDPSANQFIFRYPVQDNFGIPIGLAAYHVGINDLVAQFTQDGIISLGEQFVILENNAVLINFNPRFDRSIGNAIEGNWRSIVQNSDGFSLFSDTAGEGYVVFVRPILDKGSVVVVAPESEFVLSETTRLAFMALIAFSIFLVVFLILNLRQDRMVIIAARIKRFQLDLLRGYVESRESIDLQQWRADLEGRRSELTAEIRRGLGTLKRNEDEEVNELIRKNWDNIIEALTDSASRTIGETSAGVDWSRLEAMLARMAERISAADKAAAKPAISDISPVAADEPTHSLARLVRPETAQVEDKGNEVPAPIVEVADVADVADVAEVADMEGVDELPSSEEHADTETAVPTASPQEGGALDSILLEVWDNLDGIPELSDDSSESSRSAHSRPVETTNMQAASDRADPLTDVITLDVGEPEADVAAPAIETKGRSGGGAAMPESELTGPPLDVSTEGVAVEQRRGLFARLMAFQGAAEDQGLEPVGSDKEPQLQESPIGSAIDSPIDTTVLETEIDELEPVSSDTSSGDIEELSLAERLRMSADESPEEEAQDPEMASLARSLLEQ